MNKVPRALRLLVRPKKLGKAALCWILSRQVTALRKKHQFKLVCVAGSIGKTSTKLAIARMLGASKRVRWQEGNYNDPLTVPLIFFGRNEPGIFNIPSWLAILWQNQKAIRSDYPYDFVVAELGTDEPNTISQFAYLRPDLSVVTAVAPEHMAFFGTLDAVAAEELAVLQFSQQVLVNTDDTPAEYLQSKKFESYGLEQGDYTFTERSSQGLQGQQGKFVLPRARSFNDQVSLVGEQGAKVALAAVACADLLGLSTQEMQKGLLAVQAFAGRMQILPGIKRSTLIDDTYNSSPVAAKAALDVLQAADAPQRIAVLGSMNELGDYSQRAHEEVGAHCDPMKLNIVVTIGEDANNYLAKAAQAKGCHVQTCTSPFQAGEFVKSQLKDGALVLAKGSQNGVFAEEAIKPLLANSVDEEKLVRQSPYWMNIKQQQFPV